MKKLFLLVLLASSVLAKAQVTLLHTFDDFGSLALPAALSPTIVEDLGYYYCYMIDKDDYRFRMYYFYDSDFNLYKSFRFEVGGNVNNGIGVIPTKHLIDNDDALELIVIKNDAQNSVMHSYVMEEDGTVIYDFGNCTSVEYEFKLVNNQIRLIRHSIDIINTQYTTKVEVYGTGGDYSTGEFHLVNAAPAYPNPARSNIILPYELENGESATMSIYDLNGRLIEKFDIGSHFNQVQLNVNSYDSGIYIYEYKGKSNKFVVR